MSSAELKKKLKEGTLSIDEWNNLDADLKNQDEIQFLWQMNNVASKISPADTQSKELAWEKFDEKLDELNDSKPPNKLKPIYGVISGVAAAIAILIWWTLFKVTTITTQTGEIISHQLPDGSTAIINANSKIAYNIFRFKANRILQQKGEVFYEVEAGESFTVQTENTVIEVLGTSFNVIDRSELISVACKTGKVKVTSTKNDVQLTAGLKTILKDELLSSPAKTREGDFERINGLYSYQNETFDKILIEIQRQFGLEVDIDPQLNVLRYTGGFSNQNVDTALQQICRPMGLKYRIKENIIFIYK